MRTKSEPATTPGATPGASDFDAWLEELGLGQHRGLFADNDITAAELALLSDKDLEDLGLSLGHRRKLLAAIADKASGSHGAARSREAERRQLTIMFCDLVDSTALSERLDPEDLSELISSYQGTCADAVARFDGIVAKFMGDAVIAYFGFPRAHEDDAERAVRAGLQIAGSIARQAAQRGVVLQVRIGIATGAVVVGGMIGDTTLEPQGVVGETPNLAARLQALAGPNTVVIADATRRLVEGLFDLDDLGAQTMKGFTRAARAWAVVAERPLESRFDAARSGNLTRFIGREREMSLLLDRWNKAAHGAGQVVLLAGEAGIGKSRAIQKLFECVAEDDHVRLRHQCSPLHVNSTFYPIIRQLEAACRFSAEDSTESKVDKLVDWLVRSEAPVDDYLPHYGALLALSGHGRFAELNLAAPSTRTRILTALVDHLVTQSRRTPILLVFEDAHWIDASSLGFIRMVEERISAIPVLLIVSFRPPFDQLAANRPHVVSIDLERLNRAESAALVGNVASPKILPRHLVERIVDKTDGVPLFVEELTRMILDAPAPSKPSGRGSAAASRYAAELPSTLHDLLMARLDQLAPARRVAQVAAVIGRDFSYDILSTVSSLPAARLRLCLDQLIDAGLIIASRSRPDARFAFKHALVRDAAYTSLLNRDRRKLHAAVASFMERQHPNRFAIEPELLAHHCAEGGLVEAALKHWAIASRRALQRAASIEALGMTSQALELLSGMPHDQQRDRAELDLRLLAGGAHWAVNGFASPEVEQTFDRTRQLAESLGDFARWALALRGLIACHFARGELALAHRQADQLIELAEQNNSSADIMWATMMLGSIFFWEGAFGEARARFEAALAMYDPIEQSAKSISSQIDPAVLARANLGWTLWLLGFPDAALDATAEALAIARRIGQPYSVAVALYWDVVVRLCRGDPVAESIAELHAVTGEHHIVFYGALAIWADGASMIDAGHCAEGLDHIREGFAQLRAQHVGLSTPWALWWVAVGQFRIGRLDEARDNVTAGLAVSRSGERHWQAELHRLEGELLAASPAADCAAAQACIDEALRVARAQGAMSLELRATLTLARMLKGRGETARAKDELAAIYSRFTEGFATRDLLAAKRLLQELESPDP